MATVTESAILRAIQAYGLQLSESCSLDWGVAFTCTRFGQLDSTNQLREVIIEDSQDIVPVYESANEHFAQQGLKCRRWAPAVDQPLDKLESFLCGRGFAREDYIVMGMVDWPELEPAKNIRVLPARAMRKALQEILNNAYGESGDPLSEVKVAAAIERLNDPQTEGVVATLNGKPAGFAAFFEVGDIGMVTDLMVTSPHRRCGVGTALMAHILKLARRLVKRVTCARVPSENAAALELLGKCGMKPDGTLTEFVAPPGAALDR